MVRVPASLSWGPSPAFTHNLENQECDMGHLETPGVSTRRELAPISNYGTVAKEFGSQNRCHGVFAPQQACNKPAQGHGPDAVASLRPGYSYTATGQ